jgi:AcrR family transcriptional regulator
MAIEGQAPLPRGRHAAPRAVVERSQRTRLLQAMAQAAAEKGYARTVVADVIAGAGVSRKSFYEHFAGKEDCFLAAFDAGAELLLDAIDAALAATTDPFERTRVGVETYLETLAANPALARTALIEALGAGPAVLDHRAAVHARFAEQIGESLEAARAIVPELPAAPPLRLRACVGAIDELVLEHLRVAGAESLATLAPAAVDVITAILIGRDTEARLRAAR